MAVHYALVNNNFVDFSITEINLCHDKGNWESLKIRLISDQAYQLISMDETHIVSDQIKYMDQLKGVCSKVGGVRSTKKTRRVPRVVCRSLLRGRTGGMAPQVRPCSF